MKKIVFFVESMHCGGAERSLLNNIDATKYNIDLLVINKGGEFEKFIPSHINYKSTNTEFSLLGKLKFNFYKRVLSKRHNAQFFWKAFHSEIKPYYQEYDIAIAWGQGFATYFTAEKIKAKRKFAWVNTDYEKAGYKEEFDKQIYAKFDKIVGVSDFVKESMQKFIPTDKVTSIRNIIDVYDVSQRAGEKIPDHFDSNKINIVSVGRLAKQKAFENSVLAAKYLKNKGIDFCWYVIGEGTERTMLEGLIQQNQLDNDFKLLGFKDNPYPYIKSADIYVQTSAFEGLGRTLIEASILCKPVVTTNFPTAYGILKPNETGVITEMDSKSIAKGIIQLIDDQVLYNKIISNLEQQVDNGKENTLNEVYKLLDIS